MLPGAGQIREPHIHDLHACLFRTAITSAGDVR